MSFITGAIYFDMGIKHPIIIFEGYEYLLKRRSSVEETIWICKKYFHPVTVRCKARVTTRGNTAVIDGSHNHSSNPPKFKNLVPQLVSVIRR